MKSIKPFLTYSQQIQHLSQSKGLIINNLSAAQDALEKVSYYALIGGYKDLFNDRMTRTYKAGTTFDEFLTPYFIEN